MNYNELPLIQILDDITKLEVVSRRKNTTNNGSQSKVTNISYMYKINSIMLCVTVILIYLHSIVVSLQCM